MVVAESHSLVAAFLSLAVVVRVVVSNRTLRKPRVVLRVAALPAEAVEEVVEDRVKITVHEQV